MHYQRLVGKGDRFDDGEEESQSRPEVECVGVGEGRDRDAVDPLHGEPRATIGSDTAVEQPGDAGMFEPCESPAFDGEASHHLLARHVRADQLDGSALGKAGIGAFGGPDLAHAARTESFAQAPRAEPFRRRKVCHLQFGKRRVQGRSKFLAQGFDRPVRLPIEAEQPFDLGRQLGIARGDLLESPVTLPQLEVAQLDEPARSLFLPGGGHRCGNATGDVGRGARIFGMGAAGDSPEGDQGAVTALLAAARGGDRDAAGKVFDLIYADLRALAGRHLRAQVAGPSATSLVHEVFLRLSRRGALPFEDRQHLFAVASRAMRHVVVDRARGRQAGKRGGGQPEIDLDAIAVAAPGTSAPIEDLLALDAALSRLELAAPRLAQTVEWHFFGGLTFGEIADATAVSLRTVKRDWRAARAMLHLELTGFEPRPG